MLLRWLSEKSSFATRLSTWTLLLKPFVMAIPCVLFRGKPEPSHVTEPPERAQPAIFRLAASIGTPALARSAIASGMLSAQSPVVVSTHVPFAGRFATIEGLVTPPNELPTL